MRLPSLQGLGKIGCTQPYPASGEVVSTLNLCPKPRWRRTVCARFITNSKKTQSNLTTWILQILTLRLDCCPESPLLRICSSWEHDFLGPLNPTATSYRRRRLLSGPIEEAIPQQRLLASRRTISIEAKSFDLLLRHVYNHQLLQITEIRPSLTRTIFVPLQATQ